MSRKIRTRVSLYVFVNENGKPFYHVAHVGFFAPAIAAAIAESIDAAGLAFHRNVAGQTGMVDVMLADSVPGDLESFGPARLARSVSYTPREREESCRWRVAVDA